jgi:hypothetical protein
LKRRNSALIFWRVSLNTWRKLVASPFIKTYSPIVPGHFALIQSRIERGEA